MQPKYTVHLGHYFIDFATEIYGSARPFFVDFITDILGSAKHSFIDFASEIIVSARPITYFATEITGSKATLLLALLPKH